MTKRPHTISFGPPIPVIPVRDFKSRRLTRQDWEDVWTVCGPSVERNLLNDLPLWKVIAAAYLEGLSHGASLTEEHMKSLDPLLNYRERKVR